MGKKQKHCDPGDPLDARQGDHWDHVAYDPEHRLVVSVVPGKRTAEKAHELVVDFKRRTGGRLMSLMTSDGYSAYEDAIREAYASTEVPPRAGRRGRPAGPRKVMPQGLNYATCQKVRDNGRVVEVRTRVVFGTQASVAAALEASAVSNVVNISFVERHNGTDRNANARKTRKGYCFSKDWQVHEAVTRFTTYSYNFCWPVRTLRQKDDEGRWQEPRTPAMAAGLADHVWTVQEWLTFPAIKMNLRDP